MYENALILAGGLGTRLRPLTHAIPKPLLPIGEKPILERIIESMKEQGIKNIFISVNYKKEMIKNYFKHGETLGVNIEYIEENTFTGTAGCLAFLPDNFVGDLVVSNGDLLCDIKYENLFNSMAFNKFDFIITTIKKEYKIDFGVLNYNKDNVLLDWEEKPIMSYNINAGIYGISQEVLNYSKKSIVKNNFINMPELWKILMDNNYKIGVYNHTGSWVDIGRMEDYVKLNNESAEENLGGNK